MSRAIKLGRALSDELGQLKPIDPDEKHYPSLTIDSDDPRLRDIPNKGKCVIDYTVTDRTHREKDNGEGKKNKSCSLRLEIHSIEPTEGKSYKKQGAYGDDARKNMNEFFKDK